MRAHTADNGELIEQAIDYAEEMAELAHASVVDLNLWRQAWNDTRHTAHEPDRGAADHGTPAGLG